MKVRIIGAIFVLAVLGAVFVVTQDEGPQRPAPYGNSQSVDDGAGALKGLKIN